MCSYCSQRLQVLDHHTKKDYDSTTISCNDAYVLIGATVYWRLRNI